MGKIDTKTKEFWNDNDHFADLFNAVIFHGAPIIHPEELTEKDSEFSAAIKTNHKYLETVFKSRDVVKKYTQGMEFVLLGIENQIIVDYTMPVRTMMYDCLGYWRECQLISAANIKESKASKIPGIFSFTGKDRLHPIVTLVLFYGEDAWIGPKSLHDMLHPTGKELLGLVPDYPLNLLEIRSSDNMIFHNPDVDQVFSLVRKIYRKEITEEEFSAVRRDVAETVGTIVQSEKIIKIANNSKKEEINMCRALEEMMQERELAGKAEGRAEGKAEGRLEGKLEGKKEGKLEGKIETYFDLGFSPEYIAEKVKVSIEKVNEVLGAVGRGS